MVKPYNGGGLGCNVSLIDEAPDRLSGRMWELTFHVAGPILGLRVRGTYEVTRPTRRHKYVRDFGAWSWFRETAGLVPCRLPADVWSAALDAIRDRIVFL